MSNCGEEEVPWQGGFRDYREVDGMRVPTWGEVAWLLPDGPQPYQRGRTGSTMLDEGEPGEGTTGVPADVLR